MGQRDPVLSIVCTEPEGTTLRHVRPVNLTTEKLRDYHEKLSEFDIAFNDHVPNTPEGFASMFISVNADFTVSAKGLLFEVDDVGILYITQIVPGYSALAHFAFWDRRLRGREELCRKMLEFAFRTYDFQRIETRVALYAVPAMAATERIGFIKEGRAREAVRRNGTWYDVNLYSMLRREALNVTGS